MLGEEPSVSASEANQKTFQEIDVANPRSVVFGDVDGDGTLDMVVTRAGSGYGREDVVSIFRGIGDGSFKSPNNYKVGLGATEVELGDFNQDNQLDIIVSNKNAQSISVLIGQGYGSFERTDYKLSHRPNSIELEDFDGDGTLDLVATGLGDNNEGVVSVFKGNGDGTLKEPVNTNLDNPHRKAVLGELDGDGTLDLVTTEIIGSGYGSESVVSIRLGKSDGSFESPTNYSVGDGATSIAIGDLNTDGQLDILVANETQNSISALIGDGYGSFERTDYSVESSPTHIVLGDFNEDGHLDAIATNFDS